MKAVVTIIDDDGTIIIKDDILYPQREGIDTPAFVKFARFAFEVKTVIRPELFRRVSAAADTCDNDCEHCEWATCPKEEAKDER